MKKTAKKLLVLLTACALMIPGSFVAGTTAAAAETEAAVDAELDAIVVESGDVVKDSQVQEKADAVAKIAAPSGVKATGYDYTRIDVKWNKVSGATGYYVYCATSQNGTYKKVATVKSNSVRLKNFILKKKYYFRVRSYKGSSVSGFSSAVVSTTKETRVQVTSCTRVGKRSIRIQWTAAPGCNSYHVLRKKQGETSYTDIKTISPSTRSFTDSGLALSTKYYYAIRPVYKINNKYYKGTASLSRNTTTGNPTYRALVIGECDYPGSASDLKGPDNDADVMQSMLKKMKYPYSVVKRYNQSKSQVLSLISNSFRNATSDDVSVFYYSGHGRTDKNSYYSGALYCTDGSSLTMTELAKALNKVPGRVIVILDSCGSGAGITKGADGETLTMSPEQFNAAAVNAFAEVDTTAGDSVAKYGELRSSKFVVIAAARRWETSLTMNVGSYVYPKWGGLLTMGLAKAAGYTYPAGSYTGSSPADYNKNGKLTLAELYKYVSSYALSQSGSNPQHMTVYPSTQSNYNVFIRK